MEKQTLTVQQKQQTLFETIKTKTMKKFSQQFKAKFKKQYHQANIYTVICSIGFIKKTTNEVEIISLANGTKSLPYSVYQQHKTYLLKDMHAQILVIKAFRKFILQQIQNNQSKYFVHNVKTNKKVFNQDQYTIFLYSSEPFCGDCSVNQQQGLFSGGKPLMYFDDKQLPNEKFQKHILRTKPGRLDLPQNKRSLSLSCSDKLALYNILGIQGKQLFQKVKPVYINIFMVQCEQSKSRTIQQGLDFVHRLSKIKNYFQNLVQRKIFNIIIDSKERKISHQFKSNKPQIICIKQQQSYTNQLIQQGNQYESNKKKQKQGFELSLIFLKEYFQWINSKTGLPEGSSLNNFNKKGKISAFSKKKFLQNFSLKQNQNDLHVDQQTFKYTAIKERIKKIFGIWTDKFKTFKTQKVHNKVQHTDPTI